MAFFKIGFELVEFEEGKFFIIGLICKTKTLKINHGN